MKFIQFSAATLALFLAAACVKANLYGESYYAPYAWGHGPEKPLKAEDLARSRHPLKEVGELFRTIKSEGASDDAIALADGLAQKYRLLDPDPSMRYPDKHKIMPAGWYSGMGNLMLPFILLDLAEQTGEQRYAEAATNLFRSSAREMRDGGVVIRDEQGCHLVEYAHEDLPYEQVLFVLNGHLLALQSAYILARYQPLAEEAKAIYECGLAKTKAISSEFRGAPYPYYQVNPKEVNQISYIIFEMMQFRALFELTNDPFYKEEATYRENILRMAYPIAYRSSDDGFEYLVSLISLPHPYRLETFNTSLSCIGVESARPYSANNRDRSSIMTRGFLRISAGERLKNCTLQSDYGYSSLVLYSDPSGGESTSAPPVSYYRYQPIGHYDARVVDGRVLIDPEANVSGTYSQSAYVQLKLEQDISLNADDLIALRVCADLQVFQPMIRLDNEAGAMLRYWDRLEGSGCKLVLFSPLGFHGYEDFDFTRPKSIGFYLSTAGSTAFEIDRIDLGLVTDPFQVENLIRSGDVFRLTP